MHIVHKNLNTSDTENENLVIGVLNNLVILMSGLRIQIRNIMVLVMEMREDQKI